MHNPAQAPVRAHSAGAASSMTSRPEGATIPTHRQDGIAECGALTGAEAGKRPFRPRRALRALADGYAKWRTPCAGRFRGLRKTSFGKLKYIIP